MSKKRKSQKRQYRVLLADDDPSLLAMMEARFAAEEFALLTASDGRSVWWLLQQEQPDVVVCDYMMPYMDGLEVLSKARHDERTRDIPFIIVTATGDTENLVEALHQGADDYLTKPLVLDELVARVQKVLRSRGRESGLQGDLAQLSLPDLLQMFSQNRRSGLLEVTVPDDQIFTFSFGEGALGEIRGQPANIRGLKAFYRALTFDQGGFSFRPQTPKEEEAKEGEELPPVDFLLMEGMRQRDEISRALEQLGGTSLQFVWTGEEPPGDLEEGAGKMLTLLARGGPRTLHELLDLFTQQTDLTIVTWLLELVQGHFLEVREAPPGATEDSRRGERRRSPLHSMIGAPSIEALVEALLVADQERAFSALDGAISGEVPPEVLYRKVLVGAVREFSVRLEMLHTPPPPLDRVCQILEKLLARVLPLLQGPPPVQSTVIIGRPVGESGSLELIATFLRASGFAVIDLGSRVAPSRFLQQAMSSGGTVICVMARTEQGVQSIGQLRRLLDEQGMQRIPLVVGGPPFDREPGLVQWIGASAKAVDALDVMRCVHEVLNIPLVLAS